MTNIVMDKKEILGSIEVLKAYQREGRSMGEGYNQGAIDAYNWILKFSKEVLE